MLVHWWHASCCHGWRTWRQSRGEKVLVWDGNYAEEQGPGWKLYACVVKIIRTLYHLSFSVKFLLRAPEKIQEQEESPFSIRLSPGLLGGNRWPMSSFLKPFGYPDDSVCFFFESWNLPKGFWEKASKIGLMMTEARLLFVLMAKFALELRGADQCRSSASFSKNHGGS